MNPDDPLTRRDFLASSSAALGADALDPDEVARRITLRTKATIAVHLAGNPCNLDALKALADRHELILTEDCAQAWGARRGGKPIGTDRAAHSTAPRRRFAVTASPGWARARPDRQEGSRRGKGRGSPAFNYPQLLMVRAAAPG